MSIVEAMRYIRDAKAWIARQAEAGFGPRQMTCEAGDRAARNFAAGRLPCSECGNAKPDPCEAWCSWHRTAATHSPEAGETIARAIRWHR